MQLGTKGLELIKEFEGFRSCPYRDVAGVWTIGYGSTKGVGRNTPCITREQAEARLRREVDEIYGRAVDALKLPLTQGQHDALTSFVYNLGPGAIAPNTGIGRALRAKQWRKAADEMLRWDKAGGSTLAGLTRRRKAERALFLKATKEDAVATRHRLSPHFTVEEFDCRDGTKVMKRDYEGLEYLCRVYLEPLRKKYGPVHVNSGFRTASYNAKIGGASKSYHVYTIHSNDQAVDITCRKGGPRDWHRTANWIRKRKRNGRGGLGLYGTFVHIDLREFKADWKG